MGAFSYSGVNIRRASLSSVTLLIYSFSRFGQNTTISPPRPIYSVLFLRSRSSEDLSELLWDLFGSCFDVHVVICVFPSPLHLLKAV